MSAQPQFARCRNCEHALITGVACDTGPADCPQMDKPKQAQPLRPALGRLGNMVRSLALPSEYDAIRGSD
ncbi:hypothetical protein D5125_16895 [Magnetovirga frankeli]|uniref:hypothetical protein n=1 Tax=Magnetovirga frankeli TaxID=947516 RepID=UPI001292EE12|nr:hypothetical protein D5125_16895 [gamma proteobacterium SS-5]